jgi:hypothetical protein
LTKPVSNRKPHASLPPSMERRVTPRFGCDRGVQCWKEGTHVPFWGTFLDLSLTGCSIHLPTPLSPGTRLNMVFTLYGSNIRISGEVRTLHGDVMGVAFATMTETEQNKLFAVVQRLADGRTTGAAVVMNTQAVVLRLQRWFKNHDLLTREIFQRLVDGSFDPAFETSPTRSVEAEKTASGFSSR